MSRTPQFFEYALSVQLATDLDPLAVLGWVPKAVSADGFDFVQLVANDGVILPTGAMVDQIVGGQGLNVRAGLWAVDPTLVDTLNQITGTATAVVSIPADYFMLNVAATVYGQDIAAGDGSASAAGVFDGTSDALASPSSQLLGEASFPRVFNGATWDRARTADLFARVSATAAGNTQVVAAPGAGNRIRLMGYRISTLGTVAVAAIQDMTLQAGAAGLPFGQLNNMGAANNGTVNPSWCPLMNGYALPENTALNLNLPTALVTGQSVAEVQYLIEAI